MRRGIRASCQGQTERTYGYAQGVHICNRVRKTAACSSARHAGRDGGRFRRSDRKVLLLVIREEKDFILLDRATQARSPLFNTRRLFTCKEGIRGFERLIAAEPVSRSMKRV